MENLFYPCDPYMTFEVKLLIFFAATDPLVILTKLHDRAMLYFILKIFLKVWLSNPFMTP